MSKEENASLGKNSSFVPRIRPLIDLPEKEVALYAELKGYGISHQACPYAGEAMRQTVRAQLNAMEDRYPGTKKRIAHALGRLQEMEKGKEPMRPGGKPPTLAPARPSLQPCSECGEPSNGEQCAACRLLENLQSGSRNL
jgi:uncharacterized protein (TIGR00269 family)